MACTTVACINMCLMSDTTPPLMEGMTTIDCGFCVGYTQFQCLDSMGCHTEVAAFNCCVEAMCATAADVNACASSMCSSQLMALQTCAGSAPPCGMPAGAAYAGCYAM
jgi:hypothetical protein